ncbi:MAG: DNA replication/repair protein RecF [Bacilli bacterium]|nr:DNA replication/repair protein RecF [Bacilli bacterium]
MIIESLKLRNFRNYKELELSFDPKLNIIVGDNAEGKTNIVEAIHFLSLARSFRTNETADLISKGAQYATIEAKVGDLPIKKNIVAQLSSSGKKIICNNKALRKISDLTDLVNVIVFEPKDALMFNDSPSVRRDFLDINLSKRSHRYLEALITHDKLLKERNKILKFDNPDLNQIEVVTKQMVKASEIIVTERVNYINEINSLITKIIHAIKGEDEKARIEYHPFIEPGLDFSTRAYNAYADKRDEDLKRKMTSIGIHREDFKMIVNNQDVSVYGSQGENRISVIALKLSPYFLIDEKEKRPIIVLDDVMSELDKTHQERLLGFLRKLGQVFITSTKTNATNASIYEVKNHIVKRRNA